MRCLFDVKDAVRIILRDMEEFNISFDRAWYNFNNEWFNNSLLESDKEMVKKLI